jgi:RNA polymerase sigma factor (sigma-70 family)
LHECVAVGDFSFRWLDALPSGLVAGARPRLADLAMTTDLPDAPRDVAALLAAVRRGDKQALDVIVGAFYEQVERAVHRRLQLRFRSNARWLSGMFSTGDIVHGVFLKVMTGDLRLAQPTEGQPTEAQLVAYLIKTIESQIVDMTRYHQAARRDRRRHHSPTESGDRLAQVANVDATPLEQAWGNEQRAIFHEVLQGFGERDRELLALRIERRRSFDAIAERLGYNTPDAARKAFHSAKARLLVRLGARGIDLPSDAGGEGGMRVG